MQLKTVLVWPRPQWNLEIFTQTNYAKSSLFLISPHYEQKQNYN